MSANQGVVPSTDDSKVVEFCKSICPGVSPFLVCVRPEIGFEPLQCSLNVERKVKASGGAMICGWDISQIPKIHLEATFHAIWKSPSGAFVDVTPELAGLSQILFLKDDNRTFTGQKVPHKRFALGEGELVERYWSLVDRESAILEDLSLADFPRGHPVYRARLEGICAEIRTLKKKLMEA